MLGKNREANVKEGTIFLKERVLDPFSFTEMIICYSVGSNPQDDQADADEVLDLMRRSAKTFGIKFDSEPIWVEVEGGKQVSEWEKSLLAEKKKLKNKADIVFFLVKPNEERHYADLKKFVALEFNCPCQFSRKKMVVGNAKGGMSVASKLVMQMNAKVGHPLWTVLNQHKVWRENQVAVASIASSKGKKGTIIGFVGTTNEDLNSYFSDCKQVRDRKDLSTALF